MPVAARGRPRCASCKGDLPWLIDAGDADFAAAADAPVLVLVDLWAAWCGPCKVIAPILERIAADYAGRVKVVKVDVDQAPATAQRFDARSIPTLVLLRDGQVVQRVIGAQPEHALRSVVDGALAS